MNLRFFRLALVVIIISVTNFNCVSYSSALNSTLEENTQLSGINTLLKHAGGLNSLMGKGKKSFTLLAPTNNALAKLGPGTVENLLKPANKEQLMGLMKKHILPGKNKVGAIKDGHCKDILGNELNPGGVNFTETFQTKGGLIHVVDKVIQ
jgi:uncharacterized surface protein with fasciclin (FAS1) repeats